MSLVGLNEGAGELDRADREDSSQIIASAQQKNILLTDQHQPNQTRQQNMLSTLEMLALATLGPKMKSSAGHVLVQAHSDAHLSLGGNNTKVALSALSLDLGPLLPQ